VGNKPWPWKSFVFPGRRDVIAFTGEGAGFRPGCTCKECRNSIRFLGIGPSAGGSMAVVEAPEGLDVYALVWPRTASFNVGSWVCVCTSEQLEANAGLCTCGVRGPALSHRRNCPVKLAFWGGDPHWDRSEDHVRDGTRYRWDQSAGTWRPVFSQDEGGES